MDKMVNFRQLVSQKRYSYICWQNFAGFIGNMTSPLIYSCFCVKKIEGTEARLVFGTSTFKDQKWTCLISIPAEKPHNDVDKTFQQTL